MVLGHLVIIHLVFFLSQFCQLVLDLIGHLVISYLVISLVI